MLVDLHQPDLGYHERFGGGAVEGQTQHAALRADLPESPLTQITGAAAVDGDGDHPLAQPAMINTVAERFDPSHRLMAENDWGRYPFIAAVMAPGVHVAAAQAARLGADPHLAGRRLRFADLAEGDILGNGAVLDQSSH